MTDLEPTVIVEDVTLTGDEADEYLEETAWPADEDQWAKEYTGNGTAIVESTMVTPRERKVELEIAYLEPRPDW